MRVKDAIALNISQDLTNELEEYDDNWFILLDQNGRLHVCPNCEHNSNLLTTRRELG